MSTLYIHVEKEKTDTARFRAVMGERHSTGQTIGQAVDALLSHWEPPIELAEVFVKEPESILNGAQYEEPHLVQVNGLWVVAGGPPMSSEDCKRDFVAEMYEERERFFWDTQFQQAAKDENSS